MNHNTSYLQFKTEIIKPYHKFFGENPVSFIISVLYYKKK